MEEFRRVVVNHSAHLEILSEVRFVLVDHVGTRQTGLRAMPGTATPQSLRERDVAVPYIAGLTSPV
ncbi:hypothetical protein [Microbispora sp. NBRC 16548]|uniref:hypothetical protein n=1 Tax=Microbispora sp. NBRC 16548 TaxID=3030994 RepID=UPI00160EF799|nr:hypothetical protein [Microbispora sp. NBRC 16548]GLX11323.1 hypothetical protein Misp03_82490 [Microbispora sp. NBRC 16548]